MSFNYERREAAARQDYTRAIVSKRDLLLRKIKGDDKKSDLDINKIFTEIKNGNLSVLEDLDKAGISYTLNNNGQAFDDKSDSYSVTFEVDGATYTAYHVGLTREEEEAKEKQLPAQTRSEMFAYKGIQFVSRTKDDEKLTGNTTKPTEDVQPEEKPTVTPEAETSIAPTETVTAPTETTAATASNTSVTSNTTAVGVNNAKADELWTKILNDVANMEDKCFHDEQLGGCGALVHTIELKEYLNSYTENVKEYIKTKYNFGEDYTQLLFDYIFQKSFYENYELDEKNKIIEENGERYMVAGTYHAKKIMSSIVEYIQNSKNITDPEIQPSQNGEDFKLMPWFKNNKIKDSILGYISDEFVDMNNFCDLRYNHFDHGINCQYTEQNMLCFNAAFETILSRLNLTETEKSNYRNYGIPLDKLKELDKTGNGYMDDIYEILQDAFNQINQLNYDKLEEHLAPLLELEGEFYMSQNEFDEIKNCLAAADIEHLWDYKEDGEYPAHTEVLRFTYKGNDYEITYKRTIDTRTIDDISDEQVIDPRDYSDYSNVFVYDLENFFQPLWYGAQEVYSEEILSRITTNINNMRELLSSKEELNGRSFNEAMAIILRDYYGITANSTDEEFLEMIKKYTSDTGAKYDEMLNGSITENLKNQHLFMYDLLEKVPGYKNCLKQKYIDYTKETVTNIGGLTVTTSKSGTIDEYDYKARLEKNIQQLISGEYNSTFELIDIYDKIQHNLDMAGIEYEKSEQGSVIHFTYNGLDYEICDDSLNPVEGTVIKNTRTAADVTEEDIDKLLNSNPAGYHLFWYGETGNEKWIPEYEENWREELVRYTNQKYRYEGDAKTGYMWYAITNYLIELLKEKCGIEDYKASKDANFEAFNKYMESIDGFILDENGKRVDYNWYKLNKMLFDECPEFRDYVISIAIGPEETYVDSNQYTDTVIVRTRPAQGGLEAVPDDADSTSIIRDPNEKNGYTDVYHNSTVYVVIDPWHVVRKDEQ